MPEPNVPATAQPAENAGSAPVQAEPAGSAPAIEPEVTPAVTPESAPEETPTAEPGTTVDPGAEPAGEQKVDLNEVLKLRKRAQEAERRAAYWEGRAQTPQTLASSTPAKQEGPPPFTPLEEFSGSYEDWLSAKTRHDLKWEQEQSQKITQVDEAKKQWNEKCWRAAQEIPDLADTLNSPLQPFPTLHENVVSAITMSDVGPQLLYYLHKHPEVGAKIAQMDSHSAIMELGVVREKAKALVQTNTKKGTNAPPPINPGNAAGTTVITELADKDMSDYAKARDAETFVKVGGRLIRQ